MTLSNVKCHVRWGPSFTFFVLLELSLPNFLVSCIWNISCISNTEMQSSKKKTQSASNLFEAIFQFIEVEFIGSPGLGRLRTLDTKRHLTCDPTPTPSLTSAPGSENPLGGGSIWNQNQDFWFFYTRALHPSDIIFGAGVVWSSLCLLGFLLFSWNWL